MSCAVDRVRGWIPRPPLRATRGRPLADRDACGDPWHLRRVRRARLGLVAVALIVVGCRRRAPAPTSFDTTFGTVHARGEPRLETPELGEYLARARAELEGTPRTQPVGRRRAGRRVFLTLHAPHVAPVVTTALSATLDDSVRDAARRARPLAASAASLESVRLQLDVVVARQPAETTVLRRGELGRFGVLEADGLGRVGYVLPGEWVQRALIAERALEVDPQPVEALLAARLGAPLEGPPQRHRFQTVAVVESARDRSALLLRDGVPLVARAESAPDAETLRTAARLGGDYLARITGDDGRLLYIYDAVRDVDDATYDDIRHCGAIEGLLDTYDALRVPAHFAAAERGLGYLGQKIVRDGEVAHLPDADNAFGAVGGTGLALIAFARRAAITGDRGDFALMRAMAAFLVQQDDAEGRLQPYAPDAGESWDVMYFWGEATLGLLRMYALDHDARWLDAASRTARWRIAHPESFADDYERTHDYWFQLTLNELHAITHERVFADYALTMGRGLAAEERDDAATIARHPAGSFVDADRVAPAGARLEAIAATIALARRAGVDDRELVECARALARFVLSQQYDEESTFYLPDPQKALGGFHGAPWSDDVRMDYNQHAMLGLIGLARVIGG